MAFLVGWTGGYVLVASLLAPYSVSLAVIPYLTSLELATAATWLVCARLLFLWLHHSPT